MAPARTLAALAAMTILAGGATARAIPWTLLNVQDYQSFVANWSPATSPLCAALTTSADWDRVLNPAATMFSHKPYEPSAAFWKTHAVLLVSRVIEAGPTDRVFAVTDVRSDASTITVDYRFRPTPPASSRMKWPLALQLAAPLPPTVTFVENGAVVCVVHPGAREFR